MTAIRFSVPGIPVGKGRPKASVRHGGKGVVLRTPERTVSYEGKVAMVAQQAMAGRAPLSGPVVICLDLHFPVAQSWSKRAQADALADHVLPTRKPDADNVLKAVCDAINGIVWNDDVQVVDVVMRKRYRAVPGVHVEIEPFEPPRAVGGLL